ncbi:hypothetical protein KO481_15435 [Nocardia sp. NEAU-G5]|uniref:Uncharacterized protein n=1 Tax=Nocardia albiluteola TaxID=2842303 RepID=A0ABS6AXY8_9NOCA|nr:hypothetical protein [Nocardia albiluteola]MBU3062912.1 hypothetical protein [Nocardia albiluteola]
MHSIAGWWDSVELWVAGLPFLPQFAVVLVGMVPISFAIAYLLDRALREALRLLGRDRAAQPESVRPELVGPQQPALGADDPELATGDAMPGTHDLADDARPLSGAARG